MSGIRTIAGNPPLFTPDPSGSGFTLSQIPAVITQADFDIQFTVSTADGAPFVPKRPNRTSCGSIGISLPSRFLEITSLFRSGMR
jgi:hypothetical protein